MRTWVTLLAMALGSVPALAEHEVRVPCSYQTNVKDTCGAMACRVEGVDQPDTGAPGFCGQCRFSPDPSDARGTQDCGGSNCRNNGSCASGIVVVPVESVRPRFHLLVVDASVGALDRDGANGKPLISAGYLLEWAFCKTKPQKLDDGGYVTYVLPEWFLHTGISAAFAGAAQNTFAELGATFYRPSLPLGMTTLTLGALYQRLGASIWNPSATDENSDRLGPAVSVGFLYNLFFRVAFVLPLENGDPSDHHALLLSVLYMQDLIGDLVPDRFRNHLPEKIR